MLFVLNVRDIYEGDTKNWISLLLPSFSMQLIKTENFFKCLQSTL